MIMKGRPATAYRDEIANAMRIAFQQWINPDDDATNAPEVGEHFAHAARSVRDTEMERLHAERDMAINRSAGNVDLIGRLSHDRDEQRERVEQAEAAIKRVSTYLDALIDNGFGATDDCLRAIRSVLGPAEEKTLDREARETILYELLDLREALDAP